MGYINECPHKDISTSACGCVYVHMSVCAWGAAE